MNLFRRCRVMVPAATASMIVLAACGGSGESSEPTATPGQSSASPTSENTQPVGSNGGANTAVVTIGDQRYDFSMSGGLGRQCLKLFGFVGGAGSAADGSDIQLSIEVPPEDWESRRDDYGPPQIRVDDEVNNRDWRAGGDIVEQDARLSEADSRVTDFTNNGTSASGTAMFIDYTAFNVALASGRDAPEPVPGTFEIDCGN